MKNNETNEEFEASIRAIIGAGAPARTREIKEVKALGDRIGYGNIMEIASVLWAMNLKEHHGITSGAFVATIPSFMKKKEAAAAVNQRNNKMKIFESYLKD